MNTSRLFLFFHLFLLFFCSQAFGTPLSWPAWKEETLNELPKIPGWCSKEKGEKIMNFLSNVKPEICVEIGTFGGSTTYPIARSLQYFGKGIVWAIDSWDTQKAVEGFDSCGVDFAWWSKVDMNSCYRQFLDLLIRKDLNKWCRIKRTTSQKGLSTFADGSIDFIYIDGTLSPEGALSDAILSYRKVKRGGYIWLNDANYGVKLNAVAYLMDRCTWIKEYSLSNRSILFKKP